MEASIDILKFWFVSLVTLINTRWMNEVATLVKEIECYALKAVDEIIN
jgi:hypothetical protein